MFVRFTAQVRLHLLLTAARIPRVNAGDSRILARKVNGAGGAAQLCTYEGVGY